MAFNPYEFLQIIKESAYGTPMGSPVAGTDSIYIRLAGANRFTLRTKPKRRRVPWGGGFAAPGYTVSDQNETENGNLQVELCYSQAKLLLDWALTRVSLAQTSPWTTTEQPGDLASCTIYHGVVQDDGTVARKQYQGVKVTSLAFPISAESGIGVLNLGLRAQRKAASDPNSVAFPAPADTAFPTDPVLFRHASGGCTLGSVLAYLRGFNLNVANTLDYQYFASQFGTFDRLRGRELKCDLDVLYTASPQWRTAFEALTAEAFSAAFTNGTHTITLGCNTQALIADMSDQLEPGKVYGQVLNVEDQWDPTAAEDFHFTFS